MATRRTRNPSASAGQPLRRPSAPVVWEVHQRPIPVYDDAFEGPAHVVLCVDRASGLILAGDLVSPDAALEATVSVVVKAMRTVRPDVVAVQRQELAQLLARALDDAGIAGVEVRLVRSLPALREALRALGERLGFDPDALARYWKEVERSYPDMEGLMADIAAFYRAAPWQRLTEGDLIRGELHALRRTPAPLVRYLAVLGAAQPPAGLAAFSTAAGARSAVSSALRRLDRVAGLYMTFSALEELDDALADQLAARYAIASPAAYPLFIKQAAGGRPQEMEAVDFDELRAWLNAVRALVQADSGTASRHPSAGDSPVASETMSLTVQVRGQELHARLELERPVSRPLAVSSVAKHGLKPPRTKPHPCSQRRSITTATDRAIPPVKDLCQLSLFDDNER